MKLDYPVIRALFQHILQRDAVKVIVDYLVKLFPHGQCFAR